MDPRPGQNNMRWLRILLIVLILLILIPLLSFMWLSQQGTIQTSSLNSVPTLMATAVIPTSLPSPTVTPSPAVTLPPTFTPDGYVAVPESQVTPEFASDEQGEGTSLPAEVSLAESESSLDSDKPESNPPMEPVPGAGPVEIGEATPLSGEESRVCPGDSRVKPDYARYVLSLQAWPNPSVEPIDHFWLSKPFPGGGRFLVNQTYPYGYDLGERLLLHNGVDAAEPQGTPLLAVADGTVVVAQDDLNELYGWRCNWYGHLVVLELDQTWLGQKLYALYGHVLEIRVAVGQRVRRGDQVAEVGFGGAASVPHLHFELRVGQDAFGSTRNPLLWIDPATRGIIAGRLVDPDGRAWHGVGLSLIGHFEEASEGNAWTYLADPLQIVTVNPDEGWAENFVFTDVKPGEYTIYTKVQGEEYRARVTVKTGQVSGVDIVTAAYKTATPVP